MYLNLIYLELINEGNFSQAVRVSDIMEGQVSDLWSRLWKTEEETKSTASADLLTQVRALMSSQFSCFLLLKSVVKSHRLQL